MSVRGKFLPPQTSDFVTELRRESRPRGEREVAEGLVEGIFEEEGESLTGQLKSEGKVMVTVIGVRAESEVDAVRVKGRKGDD